MTIVTISYRKCQNQVSLMKDVSINLVHLEFMERLGKFFVLILKVPIFDGNFMFLTNCLSRLYQSKYSYFYKTIFHIKNILKKIKYRYKNTKCVMYGSNRNLLLSNVSKILLSLLLWYLLSTFIDTALSLLSLTDKKLLITYINTHCKYILQQKQVLYICNCSIHECWINPKGYFVTE